MTLFFKTGPEFPPFSSELPSLCPLPVYTQPLDLLVLIPNCFSFCVEIHLSVSVTAALRSHSRKLVSVHRLPGGGRMAPAAASRATLSALRR